MEDTAPAVSGTDSLQDTGSPSTYLGPGFQINESNIDSFEKEVMKRVNSSLSSLESSISAWDAVDSKPEDLRMKIEKYRRLHSELSKWITKMLKLAGTKSDFYARVDRLKEFSDICYTYG